MNIYFSNWHKIKNLYKIIKKKELLKSEIE